MKTTRQDKKEASEMIKEMAEIDGEKRVIYKCLECGKLFGRRYIPFGIGRGLTIHSCLCQITANRMWNTEVILEVIP